MYVPNSPHPRYVKSKIVFKREGYLSPQTISDKNEVQNINHKKTFFQKATCWKNKFSHVEEKQWQHS